MLAFSILENLPMKAMRVHTPGGIEALTYEDIPDPTPAPNEVVVRMEAAGVNFIDTYQRTGSYRSTRRSRWAWKAPASSRTWGPR